MSNQLQVALHPEVRLGTKGQRGFAGRVPLRGEIRNGAFFRLVKCTTSRSSPGRAATGGTRHGNVFHVPQGAGENAPDHQHDRAASRGVLKAGKNARLPAERGRVRRAALQPRGERANQVAENRRLAEDRLRAQAADSPSRMMRAPPSSCRSVSDLSRVVKIPVLRCTASQDIKAKPTRSLSYKGAFYQSSRRSRTVQLAAIHCATRSVHRVT